MGLTVQDAGKLLEEVVVAVFQPLHVVGIPVVGNHSGNRREQAHGGGDQGLCNTRRHHRQRRLLVESYRQFRPFDDRSFSLIEPLRGFRFVFYAGWIAKRWQDPAFPDAFPHFGTDEYWETETRDLEELVERLETGDDLRAPAEREAIRRESGEDELTNEDFFWDL